jgi:hypothetical protein
MKRPKPPSIITVAIITTITIIFWIFFEVYQILTGNVDVDVPQQLLKPLDPTLNQEILSSLKGKIEFQKDEVTHFSASVKVEQEQETEEENLSPELTPTTTPTEITEETQATPSGELSQ